MKTECVSLAIMAESQSIAVSMTTIATLASVTILFSKPDLWNLIFGDNATKHKLVSRK